MRRRFSVLYEYKETIIYGFFFLQKSHKMSLNRNLSIDENCSTMRQNRLFWRKEGM